MIKRLKIFLLSEVIQKIKEVKSYSNKLIQKIDEFELKVQEKIETLSNPIETFTVNEILEVKKEQKEEIRDNSNVFVLVNKKAN